MGLFIPALKIVVNLRKAIIMETITYQLTVKKEYA
jgi:hypothetical protein